MTAENSGAPPGRVGVISDVHGNLQALQAVLGDMGPVDLLLCLGDVVGYGAQPNEVIQVLRERGAVVLRGNHEEGVLTGETGWFNEWAAAAIRWTRTVLTPESRAYLEGISLRWEGRLGERTIEAVHGSFRDPLYEYVVGVSAARDCFERAPGEVLLVGHTHRAMAFSLEGGSTSRLHRESPGFCGTRGTSPLPLLSAGAESGSPPSDATHLPVEKTTRAFIVRVPEGDEEFRRSRNEGRGPSGLPPRLEWSLYPEGGTHPLRGRVLLNPGSVGQPRDGNPRASYGILEGDTFRVKRVEYDISSAQEEIRRAGLPEFLARRLEIGR